MSRLNFFRKFIFSLKKPKVIIVCGKSRASASEAIFNLLKSKFKVAKLSKTSFAISEIFRNQILIFELETQKLKEIQWLVKKARLPILVVTQVGEIPPEDFVFAGDTEAVREILDLAKMFPSFGFLILNFDDETVREIDDLTNLNTLTFGFQKRADIFASDLHLNFGTNFKINYSGNIVPVWLKALFGKEYIFAALAAAALGIVFGLNLVEISQALKNYKGLPGKMRLIEGLKKTWILDDSENASSLSMIEALLTLGKIPPEKYGGRKIAVLGDILGIGKYTIEVHEAIGEKVEKVADLLFTVGPRAKFIAKGAREKGMREEKIFQFDNTKEAKMALKEEIKKGDLILIDGSAEMKMSEIVKEIKLGC